MGLREDILGFNDKKFVVFPIPEWNMANTTIIVMDGLSRDKWETQIYERAENRSKQSNRGLFACLVIGDSEGKRLFNDSDVEALSQKSGIVLDRILAEGLKLNKLRAEDIEELSKN